MVLVGRGQEVGTGDPVPVNQDQNPVRNHPERMIVTKRELDQKIVIKNVMKLSKRKNHAKDLDQDLATDLNHVIGNDRVHATAKDHDHVIAAEENQPALEVHANAADQGNQKAQSGIKIRIEAGRRRRIKRNVRIRGIQEIQEVPAKYQEIMMKRRKVLIRKRMETKIRMGIIKMSRMLKVHKILEVDRRRTLQRNLIIWIFQILHKFWNEQSELDSVLSDSVG